MDLIGHNLENKTNTDPTFDKIEFLSYDKTIKDDISYPVAVSSEYACEVNTSQDISFILQLMEKELHHRHLLPCSVQGYLQLMAQTSLMLRLKLTAAVHSMQTYLQTWNIT